MLSLLSVPAALLGLLPAHPECGQEGHPQEDGVPPHQCQEFISDSADRASPGFLVPGGSQMGLLG